MSSSGRSPLSQPQQGLGEEVVSADGGNAVGLDVHRGLLLPRLAHLRGAVPTALLHGALGNAVARHSDLAMLAPGTRPISNTSTRSGRKKQYDQVHEGVLPKSCLEFSEKTGRQSSLGGAPEEQRGERSERYDRPPVANSVQCCISVYSPILGRGLRTPAAEGDGGGNNTLPKPFRMRSPMFSTLLRNGVDVCCFCPVAHRGRHSTLSRNAVRSYFPLRCATA